MWHNTDVQRRLKIRYPIIQGPFGGGLSTPELAATVSNGGGLGSFGAHILSPQQIRELVPRIRALTDQPFALNLWVSDHDQAAETITPAEFDRHRARLEPYYRELGVAPPERPAVIGPSFAEQAEALLEARPPVFSFVFGIPDQAILEACRRRGIVTVGTATTLDEALALDEARVDLIVASGSDAGGHRGAFLRAAHDSLVGTLALIPAVVDRVRTPVIAAGGIADGRGIAAALALGAQGVQIGTAFLACDESGASPIHRQRLFAAEARYTTLTRAFSGRLARGIQNRLSAELGAVEAALPPYPVQSWLTQPLKQSATGQGDLMAMWSGQAAPLLRHTSAADLLGDLVAQTATALRRLAV